jgi:hypothetical protein
MVAYDPSGNVSESLLSWSPGRADTGRFLKCRAENPDIAASQLEDSWILDINCEFS